MLSPEISLTYARAVCPPKVPRCICDSAEGGFPKQWSGSVLRFNFVSGTVTEKKASSLAGSHRAVVSHG